MGKMRKIIALAIVSFLVSLSLFLSGALDGFEIKAYDFFSKRLNPSSPGHDIVVIKVDQRSIDALSDEGVRWPWPRQMYAPIIEFLSKADAVHIDILFTEPSSYGVEDDLIMARAVAAAPNTYFPVFLTEKAKPLSEADMDFLRRISFEKEDALGIRFSSAIAPIDEFEEGAKGGGNVTIAPDSDGVYRRTPIIFNIKGLGVPNFALSFLVSNNRLSVCGDDMCFDGKRVALEDGGMLLRYYKEPFDSFSAIDILRSYSGEDKGLSREMFTGKKVFIGLTAAGLYDLKPTSMSSIATGVDIHATALQNVLSGDYIRPLDNFWTISLMFLACFAVSALVLRFYSLHITMPAFAILLVAGVILPASLFAKGFYLNIVSTPAALMTAFMLSVAYSYAVEGRERRFTKRAFSQYMDTKLVDYLLNNPHLIRPGGKRNKVTIFFADLAGFTTLAEKIPAEDAARVLHMVLNAFTEAIIARGGVVDKYMGDAVMAFWGAPIAGDRDEANACMCALDCIESLNEINRTIKSEGFSDISARVGIHTGEAIVGNLGSDRLFDYTVVGDTVNLASRLESVNKIFNTSIIASEDTIVRVGELFLLRELGKVEVKGKTKAVRIYEVMCDASGASEKENDIVLFFKKGMALYYEQRWHEALESFNNALAKAPDDGPSKFYVDRCKMLLNNPEDGWETIRLTEK